MKPENNPVTSLKNKALNSLETKADYRHKKIKITVKL